MNKDIAERFAATAIDGITVEETRMIIREFLTQIARCPVCDRSGQITFSRDTPVKLYDSYQQSQKDVHIPAGTVGACPRCGGQDVSGGYDPDYVAWHCVQGWADRDCRNAKGSGQQDQRDGHDSCGFRVVLPLDAAGGS